ncbi:MAG: AI-2E family transporter [Chromatiales bacterium]|nr:AI-2E family transporter [Chromatiales bacterium]
MTDTMQRLAAGAVLALAIGYVLYVGRAILVPLVLALFIAWVFWTLVEWLRAAPVVGRLLPGWAVHLAALLLLSVLIWAMVLLVAGNIAQVADQLPGYRGNLEALLGRIAALIGLENAPTVEQLFDELLARLDMGQLVGSAVGVLSVLAGNLVVVLIYTAFLIIERNALAAKLARLAGTEAGGRRMSQALAEISARIGQYLVLKTFVSAIVGVLSWIIMWLIGIDFAAFWAVMIFVLNFIPYVGSFIAVLLPVTLSLVQFESLGPFLVALVTLTGIQVAVGNAIEPRMMGNSLNLSPVVILLSLAAWSALWGVAGAFLCVPITVIMLIVFAEFETTRPLAILLSQDGRIDAVSS